MEMRGIDPRAFRMQSGRSTAELHPPPHYNNSQRLSALSSLPLEMRSIRLKGPTVEKKRVIQTSLLGKGGKTHLQ